MAYDGTKWHKELSIFSKIKSLVILEGNVLDTFQYPGDDKMESGALLKLPQYLNSMYLNMGYKNVVFYDNINGFYNEFDESGNTIDRIAKIANKAADKDGFIKSEFKFRGVDSAPYKVRSILSQTKEPSVVIMTFASRYISEPQNLDQVEVDSFSVLQQAALDSASVKTDCGRLSNLLIMITSKVNDLPAWFYLNNPSAKIVTLAFPGREEREELVFGNQFSTFFDKEIFSNENPYYEAHPDEIKKIRDKFVALTEGFCFVELMELRKLCKNEKIHIKDMCDVIDLYKYGVKENPWKSSALSEKIRNGNATMESRVKGQSYAISRSLDVIKRAITGFSGLQGSSHGRPKGVLFFAGPTGTGKTEMAKTLAEILFGDENSCIRFDMSEYSQGHSDQKLLGAPPGYIGYESGGQLTNAVKKNPFSILLFDEIEKAHPSILDKFLQILEDGRMTDGQGNTVYFSETIIVFTSNLGVYVRDEDGNRVENINHDMSYCEMTFHIKNAIEDYFKITLGRPEILNRIGENIVVFDYIRPETAFQIIDSQLKRIFDTMKTEHKIEISISEEAKNTLQAEAIKNLDNGGRGIGNVVESMIINPLSRYIFDNGIDKGAALMIENIDATSMPPSMTCSRKMS